MSSTPIVLPPSYDIDLAKTCAGLVNVASDMGTQWTTWRGAHKLANPTDFNAAWKPQDTCSITKTDVSNYTFSSLIYGVNNLFGVDDTEAFAFLATPKSASSYNAFLVFRGTKSDADLLSDLKYAQVPYVGPDQKQHGLVDKGFYGVFTTTGLVWKLQMSAMVTNVLKALPVSTTSLVITGHSLGSALATLAVPIAASLGLKTVQYNQASPRVCDPTLASYMNSLVATNTSVAIPTYRLVNVEDIVPTVPLPESPIAGGPSALYQHVGTPVSFSAQYGSVGNNHNPCGSYAYALYNPESPQS